MTSKLSPSILLVLVAAFGLHRFQRGVDEARFAGLADRQTIFVPDGEAMRVASLGHHHMAADIMWVRTVLRFVEVFEGREPEGVRWLGAMLNTVATLDPRWRTLYFYGGGMLRTVQDVEGSSALYSRGMEAMPDDPFFPFSIGMNAYMFNKDVATAKHYLDLAAGLPGAPIWYRSAAAGFLAESGQRRAAVAYLEEQLALEGDPRVQIVLRGKLLNLVHEELASRLNSRREEWEARTGRRLSAVAVLGELPPVPDGSAWLVGPDGEIRSAGHERSLAERAQRQGRRMLTEAAQP
jgi:hypothetical protein